MRASSAPRAEELTDAEAHVDRLHRDILCRVQRDLKLLRGSVSSAIKLNVLSNLAKEVVGKDGGSVATALVRVTDGGSDIFDAFVSILGRFKSRPFEEIERRCLRDFFQLLGDVLAALDASFNFYAAKRIKMKVFGPLLDFCRGPAQLSPDLSSKLNAKLAKLAKEGSLVG